MTEPFSNIRSTPQGRLPTLGLVLASAVSVFALLDLAPPGGVLQDAGSLGDTADGVEVMGAALGIFALIALVGAGYVLAVSTFTLVASFGRPSKGLARMVRAVTVPALRWALPGTLSLSVLVAPLPASAISLATGGHKPQQIATIASAAIGSETDEDDALLWMVDQPAGPHVGSDDTAVFRLIEPTTTTTTTSRPQRVRAPVRPGLL